MRLVQIMGLKIPVEVKIWMEVRKRKMEVKIWMEVRKRKMENFHPIEKMSVVEAAKSHTCQLFHFLSPRPTTVFGQAKDRKMPV
jgi:hypothetical protein